MPHYTTISSHLADALAHPKTCLLCEVEKDINFFSIEQVHDLCNRCSWIRGVRMVCCASCENVKPGTFFSKQERKLQIPTCSDCNTLKRSLRHSTKIWCVTCMVAKKAKHFLRQPSSKWNRTCYECRSISGGLSAAQIPEAIGLQMGKKWSEKGKTRVIQVSAGIDFSLKWSQLNPINWRKEWRVIKTHMKSILEVAWNATFVISKKRSRSLCRVIKLAEFAISVRLSWNFAFVTVAKCPRASPLFCLRSTNTRIVLCAEKEAS